MSGTPSAGLGLLTLVGPGAPSGSATAMFLGANYQSFPGVGAMAFRLEGTAVPEPASWLMAASAGAVGLALARRRRRAA